MKSNAAKKSKKKKLPLIEKAPMPFFKITFLKDFQ